MTTLDPDAVWISSGDHVLFFDGVAWSAEAAPTFGNLFATARDDLYLVGPQGLFHRDRSGWHYLFGGGGSDVLHVGEYLLEVWASSPNDVWVRGQDNTDWSVVLHHFDGAGWSIPLRRPNYFCCGRAIAGTAPDDVWFGAHELLHYDGSSWRPIAGEIDVGSVVAAGRGKVWVNGCNPKDWRDCGLYLVDESGGWTRHAASGAGFVTGETIFAFGEGGAILSRPK